MMYFSFQTITHASSVGQSLPVPDNGWHRYEDTNSGFVYEGQSWKLLTNGIFSGNSEKFTLDASLHSVKFSFVGEKLRLINYRGPDRQSSIKVNIDGVDYNYSANGTSQGTTLLFEKLNLENKVHSVVISAVNSGTYQIFEFDAIDINETGYLINKNISAPSNLTATGGDTKVDLSWTNVSNATGYNIKRGLTANGPYNTIATNVTGTVYLDTSVTNGTTYFYVVTALNNNDESLVSNEASATPQKANQPEPEPSGDRAILTVTLTTGLEKEFDLSNSEVNAFLEWYDARDSGTGPAKFAINKHDNNKGPFSKRAEYVIFDKILTFSIDEYSAK